MPGNIYDPLNTGMGAFSPSGTPAAKTAANPAAIGTSENPWGTTGNNFGPGGAFGAPGPTAAISSGGGPGQSGSNYGPLGPFGAPGPTIPVPRTPNVPPPAGGGLTIPFVGPPGAVNNSPQNTQSPWGTTPSLYAPLQPQASSSDLGYIRPRDRITDSILNNGMGHIGSSGLFRLR